MPAVSYVSIDTMLTTRLRRYTPRRQPVLTKPPCAYTQPVAAPHGIGALRSPANRPPASGSQPRSDHQRVDPTAPNTPVIQQTTWAQVRNRPDLPDTGRTSIRIEQVLDAYASSPRHRPPGYPPVSTTNWRALAALLPEGAKSG